MGHCAVADNCTVPCSVGSGRRIPKSGMPLHTGTGDRMHYNTLGIPAQEPEGKFVYCANAVERVLDRIRNWSIRKKKNKPERESSKMLPSKNWYTSISRYIPLMYP